MGCQRNSGRLLYEAVISLVNLLFCRSVTSTGLPRKSRGKAVLLPTQVKEEHSKEVQRFPPEPSKEAAAQKEGGR